MRLSVVLFICLSLFTSCSLSDSYEHDMLTYVDASSASSDSGKKMSARKVTTAETKNAGSINFYTVSAAPVAARKRFFLISGQVPDDYESGLELVSDDYGALWSTGDRQIRLERMLFPMICFLEGQQYSFWIVSSDRKTVLNTKFVPYPLVGYAEDGAEISITHLTTNASSSLCRGSYFKANEVVEVIIQGKNCSSSKSIQCKNGMFSCHIVPPDAKSYGEVLSIKLQRENGSCITVAYPWGRDYFNKKYLRADASKLDEEDWKVLDGVCEAFYNPHMCTREHVI